MQDHDIPRSLETVKSVLSFLFVLGTMILQAEEVSTKPPAWFFEVIEPRLTKVEDLDLGAARAMGKDVPGIVHLTESITRIRENGIQDVAFHYVYEPLTENGVKQVRQDQFPFSAENQTVHVVRAQTTSPDGKTTEASKDGIFRKRPDGDREAAIYSDREDLVIIYSDVKVGSLVEVVVLREGLKPRVEGESSGFRPLASGTWPVGRLRHLVGLGEKMKKRFRSGAVGKGVPRAKISKIDDLTWHEWSVANLKALPFEVNRAPVSQIGPAISFTTFRSWPQLGKWYAGYVAPQGKLDSSIEEKMKTAVAGLEKPREVLNALYQLAAKEVRYTGLEFGESSILPYSCSEVWERKYGDCKDKSNLLVTMLRSQGIEAWMGLVNTEGEGLVPKDLPGTNAFNHAIAVVDLDPGEKEDLVFCDPTIRYGRPGLITPSVGDRDVLLVSKESGRLVRSPAAEGGSRDYHFDLEMDETGRLSGWLVSKTTGFYAVETVTSLSGTDRNGILFRTGSIVRTFFPGAEVADYKLPDDFGSGLNECVIRIFFTTPPVEWQAGAPIPVSFPQSRILITGYGDQKTRTSTFYQWRESASVKLELKIADGLVPVTLHPPIRAASPGYQIEGEWGFQDSIVKASCRVKCLKSVLQPDEVLSAQQANRAWESWANQPLLLKQGKDWKAPQAQAEVKLPLMPTGQGQLALVDRWYPNGSDPEKRRAALRKVMVLFPDDPETLFDARLFLARVDLTAGKTKKALEEFQKLTAIRPPGASNESFSLAHFLVGICANELKNNRLAAEAFAKSVSVEGRSPYRHSWGLTQQGGALLRLGKFEEARARMLEAEKMPGDHRQVLLYFAIHLSLKTGRNDEAIATWKRFRKMPEVDALSLLDVLLSSPADPLLASTDRLEKFLQSLKPELNKEQAAALDQLLKSFSFQRNKLGFAQELRTALLAEVEKLSPAYLSKDLHPELESRASYLARLRALFGREPREWMRHAYGYLKRFEADEGFSLFFWQVMLHVERTEATLPEIQRVLFDPMIALSEKIPRQDDQYWECRFLVANRLMRTGKSEEVDKLCRSMREDPLFKDHFDLPLWALQARVNEQLGKWPEAVEAHLKLKDQRMVLGMACSSLLRAGWIQARLGKYDEALTSWKLLGEVPKTCYQLEQDKEFIMEAILLSGTPEKTKNFWKSTNEWWKKSVVKFRDKHGFKIADEPPLSDQSRRLILGELARKPRKSREDLAKMLTVILSGARWFPSFSMDLQEMSESFVAIIARDSHQDFRRLAMQLLDLVDVGTEASRVTAAVQGTAFKAVLGEKDALEHCYRTLKMTEGEAFKDAREGVLRRIAFLVTQSKQDFKKAEELLRDTWLKSAKKEGRFNIGICLAQVLGAQKRNAEAKAVIKEVQKLPAVRDNPELNKALKEYLDSLGGEERQQSGYLKVLDEIHKLQPVPWLEHVRPKDLSEKGFEDLDGFLAGRPPRCHVIEAYRWGWLILKSEKVTPKQRAEAFEILVNYHLANCPRISMCYEIENLIFDSDQIPVALKTDLIWPRTANAAVVFRDPQRVRHLANHPASRTLPEPLRLSFGNLEKLAVVAKQGAEEKLALLKELVGKGEIDFLIGGLVNSLTAQISFHFDPKLNAKVEALLETASWKGQNESFGRRKVLMFRQLVRKTIEATQHAKPLLEAFPERIKELTEMAPKDWKDFPGLPADHSISEEERAGLAARIALEGKSSVILDTELWGEIVPWLVRTSEGKLDLDAWKRFLTYLAKMEDKNLAYVFFASTIRSAALGPEQCVTMLRACRPWVESRNDLSWSRLLTMLEFFHGIADPDEAELIRLAHEVAPGRNYVNIMVTRNFVTMLLDQENKEPLKEFVKAIPDTQRYGKVFPLEMLQAFRQVGDRDAAELVELELEDLLAGMWMDAWDQADWGDFRRAAAAYWGLGMAKGNPIPVWMRKIPATFPEKARQVRGRILLLMTEGKWKEVETLTRENKSLLEKPEAAILFACCDLGMEKEGARENAVKMLRTKDKLDSFGFHLREMLRE